MRQLMLGQTVKKIALIFFSVCAAKKQKTPGIGVIFDPCVMTAGNAIKAHFQRTVQKRAEFQSPVANDAGIGCAACFISADKRLYDSLPEVVRLIQNIEGDLQTVSHIPGILYGCGRHMTGQLRAAKLHNGTGALIACFLHQPGDHRAVNTAAHGDQRFFHSGTSISK